MQHFIARRPSLSEEAAVEFCFISVMVYVFSVHSLTRTYVRIYAQRGREGGRLAQVTKGDRKVSMKGVNAEKGEKIKYITVTCSY